MEIFHEYDLDEVRPQHNGMLYPLRRNIHPLAGGLWTLQAPLNNVDEEDKETCGKPCEKVSLGKERSPN